MDKCRCGKCNYEWVPRIPVEKIKECPKCKTYMWRKKSTLHEEEKEG